MLKNCFAKSVEIVEIVLNKFKKELYFLKFLFIFVFVSKDLKIKNYLNIFEPAKQALLPKASSMRKS